MSKTGCTNALVFKRLRKGRKWYAVADSSTHAEQRPGKSRDTSSWRRTFRNVDESQRIGAVAALSQPTGLARRQDTAVLSYAESQFIGASRIQITTWWTAAFVRLTFPVVSVCNQQPTSAGQLVVPRHRRSKFGRRSFSVAAPMAWNSFPDSSGSNAEHRQLRSALNSHLFVAQRDT